MDKTEYGSFSYNVHQKKGKFHSEFNYALSLGLPAKLLTGYDTLFLVATRPGLNWVRAGFADTKGKPESRSLAYDTSY